ncbi:hypothetical protein FFWV33_11690 [Flavobacterium faecale]|uniref:Lipocalin-like domain-containing protein n=1 Tax=Flavobacterium faecale TaxID=1355330 RepID=A0A2S1LEF8_9FLAO|nr:hypothetical protein [Flavobacterium faecale]AWG22125.1 hypothetical protein FFWV33_11690 [Flavobacterium faecale]
MKKKILIIFSFILFVACSKEDENPSKAVVIGTYQLIEKEGSIPNSVQTGIDMEWQEKYVLRGDNTFTKTRIRDGVVLEASGSYETNISSANENLIIFYYATPNVLVGSCGSDKQEGALFQTESIFVSSWHACDGPRLTYEKMD